VTGRRDARRAAARRFRRPRHVVAYWNGSDFVLHNLATQARAIVAPSAVQVLHLLQRPGTAKDVARAAPWLGPAKLVRAAIDRLAAASFLVAAGDPGRAEERALDAWGGWNPAASFFHFATKDLERAAGRELNAGEARFRRRARSGPPPPPPVKRIRGARLVRLPRSSPDGEFADVLLSRRTWRGFGRAPLSLGDLALILDLTWGVRGWGEAGYRDRVAFKTSPSSGARHPSEAYLLALRVKGLQRAGSITTPRTVTRSRWFARGRACASSGRTCATSGGTSLLGPSCS